MTWRERALAGAPQEQLLARRDAQPAQQQQQRGGGQVRAGGGEPALQRVEDELGLVVALPRAGGEAQELDERRGGGGHAGLV